MSEVKDNNGETIFIKADVTNSDDVKNYIENYGQDDLFYNNADIVGKSALTTNISDDQISVTIDINLKSVIYGRLKYVVQAMEKSGEGSIVSTASEAGLGAVYSMIVYSRSKHEVIGETKTAALEYADKNIRINAVVPGNVKTPMIDDIDPETQKQIEASIPIPMKRQGETSEIIELVMFLLSDQATYITGSIVTIDGGPSLLSFNYTKIICKYKEDLISDRY